MKLGHIGIPVHNIEEAKVFYDGIAEIIGLKLMSSHDDFVGYGEDSSYKFYVHTGREGIKGLHVCFEVETRDLVDEFYSKALTSGGLDNGKPGVRESYSSTYYAAFVTDPDGNNIEAVCRK